MITLREIKAAIVNVLKTKYPECKVHFDNVEKSDAPYFYVEFMPTATTVDDLFSDRLIQVDITYIHPKDAMGRVSRTAVFEVADALDKVFRPVLAVKDRHITILDAEMTIVDDILHYIFNLDFRDNFEDAGRIQYELAQHLELEINKFNQTEGE
ncbi:hypothetical protein SAMN02910401_00449 [Megasphaera elsdenii]|uniref:phage tail terminator family protein n=1 Tax=Megasphaera elsdenii TaxID=907 RepID=UPI0008EEFE25|nr:hypothetical protein [Megasphaera elsdenii]SFH81967.1 hypothetical protein SAMN02910401_00449 [Megasphaera elsdenii]